jgi:hypothetical protein
MAKPEQKDLPGMEDREIKDLVSAARKYANVRDDRQVLTAKEVTLKQELLTLMKRHRKTEYIFDGIEIRVVTEEETVKVRIHKEKDGEED